MASSASANRISRSQVRSLIAIIESGSLAMAAKTLIPVLGAFAPD